MLVAGYMAKQRSAGAAQPSQAGGGLGDMLGSLFGGQTAGVGSASPGAPAGGLASMLDLNGDGNPLDDILRMASKGLR
jgi:hypothetical protein